jgi:hypothetical protein
LIQFHLGAVCFLSCLDFQSSSKVATPCLFAAHLEEKYWNYRAIYCDGSKLLMVHLLHVVSMFHLWNELFLGGWIPITACCLPNWLQYYRPWGSLKLTPSLNGSSVLTLK